MRKKRISLKDLIPPHLISFDNCEIPNNYRNKVIFQVYYTDSEFVYVLVFNRGVFEGEIPISISLWNDQEKLKKLINSRMQN